MVDVGNKKAFFNKFVESFFSFWLPIYLTGPREKGEGKAFVSLVGKESHHVTKYQGSKTSLGVFLGLGGLVSARLGMGGWANGSLGAARCYFVCAEGGRARVGPGVPRHGGCIASFPCYDIRSDSSRRKEEKKTHSIHTEEIVKYIHSSIDSLYADRQRD